MKGNLPGTEKFRFLAVSLYAASIYICSILLPQPRRCFLTSNRINTFVNKTFCVAQQLSCIHFNQLINPGKCCSWHKWLFHYIQYISKSLTLWHRKYFFFLILAQPVYKMWIIQEPNKLALWNKLHFEEKKMESTEHV